MEGPSKAEGRRGWAAERGGPLGIMHMRPISLEFSGCALLRPFLTPAASELQGGGILASVRGSLGFQAAGERGRGEPEFAGMKGCSFSPGICRREMHSPLLLSGSLCHSTSPDLRLLWATSYFLDSDKEEE
ncbi:hypothetical protein HJG60_010764 [Phyllostomus discolor]|uniref:Uncharacterized protein n=1 Tax=Phyllostomus discolor TaxID=89673 RepID=A0A834EA62_9CHIR|nr:hypothetical protein HJG60_010764 [Phyllostomus discolor]